MLSEGAIRSSDIYMSDRVRDWSIEVARRQVEIYEEIIQRGIK